VCNVGFIPSVCTSKTDDDKSGDIKEKKNPSYLTRFTIFNSIESLILLLIAILACIAKTFQKLKLLRK